MLEILKELFTFKTVYIDKGQGQWAVRKRLHPFTRGFIFIVVVSMVGVIFLKSPSDSAISAVNEKNEIKEIKTVKSIEPVKPVLVPVKENKHNPEQVTVMTQPVAVTPVKPVLIPANKNQNKPATSNNSKTSNTASLKVKSDKIILPSEKDPQTDRIINYKKDNNYNNKYRIIINKSRHTLSLLKGDELIKNYPVATGKNTGDKERVGDHRTPVGKFKIVSIENASSWSHDFRDGKGKIAGAYGPWFLRLDAKGWRGIGIHGTHDPDSRGTNATEGCIRLSNEDIAELKEKYAYRNMPVEIREN